MNSHLDYRGQHVPLLTKTTGALVPLSLVGCLQTVDMRSQGGDGPGDGVISDTDCNEGERLNPASGACDACVRDEGTEVCPCAFTLVAAPFPYCRGDAVRAECAAACVGDKSVCNGYDSAAQFVRDCVLFAACCDSLAAQSGSTPCCPPDSWMFCPNGQGDFSCFDETCCETTCIDINDCDPSFQACEAGHCTPGCAPTEYCHHDVGGCECRTVPSPP